MWRPSLGVSAILALCAQTLAADNLSLTTISSPYPTSLPKYLQDGPMPGGSPWGNADPGSSTSVPNTGKIRRYDFTITRAYINPDGQNKTAILVNGQFPGPLIEANWGDTIEVKVNNRLDDDQGVSIHWHGLTQVRTPYYDGVPGVSQCPLAPGTSFTYQFQADQYGTSWYHSHYGSQYSDGAFGPMIIHGPLHGDVDYDVDLGPLLISDYFYESYDKIVADTFQIPPVFPNWDNNLFNGKGLYNCKLATNSSNCEEYGDLTTFEFEPGKTYRLRLINSGAGSNQKFSIDDHELTVIANDFVPVKPYKTKVVTLGVGQRTDILVKATGRSTDSVYMRSDFDTDCLNATWTNMHALAPVYYPQADRSKQPTTSPTAWESNHCRNDPLSMTIPFYPQTPPHAPATTQTINVTLHTNATGHLLFYTNETTFRTNYDHPVLLLSKLGNTSYPDSPEWNVFNFGSNSSVRMVIINSYEMQHPMHLHGHNFWVLNEGRGTWDGTVTNPTNPQRRDTHILEPGTINNPSYAVIEWAQDNPGVWPFHCHSSIHISYGLGLLVMERPEDIKNGIDVPMTLAQTCRDWAKFSGSEVVDQIDSGL